jgi:hypothetical protein
VDSGAAREVEVGTGSGAVPFEPSSEILVWIV